jgi:hypothetical protein
LVVCGNCGRKGFSILDTTFVDGERLEGLPDHSVEDIWGTSGAAARTRKEANASTPFSVRVPTTMSSIALKEESPAESSAMARERESQGAPPTATVPKGKSRMTTTEERRNPTIPHVYHSMMAGAGAGLVSSIATCPLDVIKTRLQASSAPGESVKSLVTTIWRTSGVRGMYRGLGPTILGYLPTWGIYFSVYDDIKDKLGKSIGGGQGAANEQWAVHILAAMTAGATGTIATNPLWVIKTRFMVSLPLSRACSRG